MRTVHRPSALRFPDERNEALKTTNGPGWGLRLLCMLAISAVPFHMATAQYAIGITVGAAHLDLQERKRKNTTGSLNFEGVDQPAWSMAVFYREHTPGRLHLGGELQVDRRRFSASWSDGGLGSGESTTASVELYTVRLALLPEVNLDQPGNTRLRFGLALGAVVAGRMNGTRTGWGLNGTLNETLEDADPKGFGGELRAMLGLGIRVPLTAGGELVIDPYRPQPGAHGPCRWRLALLGVGPAAGVGLHHQAHGPHRMGPPTRPLTSLARAFVRMRGARTPPREARPC